MAIVMFNEKNTMRHRFVLIILLLLSLSGAVVSAAPLDLHATQAAQQQAPQIASYRMSARLDPAAKTVSGDGRIVYQNPSQDTLSEVWLRLYLRAFRDTQTTWMRESGGQHRGFGSAEQALGDITVGKLTTADGADLLASATLTDTLMRVPLPQPLAPGQRLELDVSWVSTLPRVFARTGYGGRDDTFFMVGQWYPKMAVYDRGRWDTEPWHANSEFFHDFGSYDVSISVPQEYVVAGAGVPAGEQAQGDGTKTLRFTAEDVTDFAFAASPDFRTRSAKSAGADVVLYYLPEHEAGVAEYMTAAVGSLAAYSSWYGAYPHPRLTVVDVPDNAGAAGGMEYPTLVTGGTVGVSGGVGAIALVTAHEIGHQWWPMQTATNEGREPWLDEGLTEYSGMRYMVESGTRLGSGSVGVGADLLDKGEYAMFPNLPATLPSWQYDSSEYVVVYAKTAVGVWTLERVVGTDRFRRAMADYLAAYRFKHPTAADFRASLERSLGGNLSWFFDDYMSGTGVIDYAVGPIEQGADGSSFEVIREGAVRAPVEIRVVLASGAERLETWSGQTERTSFSYPPGDPVARVEADPAQKLKAELDLLDNGASASADAGRALTLAGRLVFWMQTLVQSIGLFG